MNLCEAGLPTKERTSAKTTTIGTGLQTACWLPSGTTAVDLKADFCIGLTQPSTSGVKFAEESPTNCATSSRTESKTNRVKQLSRRLTTLPAYLSRKA